MVLSLKSCKLRELGDDVAELGCLKELYLETNLILSLPQHFTRLRTLEVTTWVNRVVYWRLRGETRGRSHKTNADRLTDRAV